MIFPEGSSFCSKSKSRTLRDNNAHPYFRAVANSSASFKNAPPLLSSVSLVPSQRAGQCSGLPPNLRIGRDRPVAGTPVDDRDNLLDDLTSLGVSGIEQAASRRQFSFCDRGMPCFGRPQHHFA